MLAGINNGKPELFISDVTGNYLSYYANAIGENDETIKNKLREKYRKDFSIKEGVKLALEIFEEIKGKDFNVEGFELAYINKEKEKLKYLEGKEIKELKWRVNKDKDILNLMQEREKQ